MEGRRRPALDDLRDRLLDAGQEDLERGAPAALALAPQVASALLDDPVGRREAEARPLAPLLRREEGLEEARLDLVGNSDARVADGDADVGAGLGRHVAAGEPLVQVGGGGLD